MSNARKRSRQRRRAKSLIGSIRDFLTPEVFKQVRNTSRRRKSPRWDLHPLLYILLLTTYCCGDSLPEKFETARTFYVACCPKRKRPGRHFGGFEKAVAKLPMPVLRTLAIAIRRRAETVFNDRWKVGGFIPFGCDGTRQACPRSDELEKRLGTFGKEGSPPMIWNTSIVHLTLGFPWCWRWGKGGKASERSHLLFMLKWLPECALIVADAGYVGFGMIGELAANVCFLIRMSSHATFYAEENIPLTEFCEGIVYYWPKQQQTQGKPPIRGRLLRIHSQRHKADVWLFTNVLDSKQLSLETAGVYYRWRWENEGFFRTYKRTLKKATLMSRTLRLIHREAEASMIATQLLLCQGALAMPAPKKDRLPVMCSPRGVLLEARRDIAARSKPSKPFTKRIAFAQREQRLRHSLKQKREWPRRKKHRPPQPPLLLRLSEVQKVHMQNRLCAV
jgi:hypothetical protein